MTWAQQNQLYEKINSRKWEQSLIFLGTGGGTRTHGQEIKSLLLYQLSYAGSQAKVLKVSVLKLWSRSMLFRFLYAIIPPSITLFAETWTDLPPVSTFSIVARDAVTEEIGVAVQSKFIAVGSVVPYAKAEIGAVATQAWGNVQYGPVGIKLMSLGKTPSQSIDLLTQNDPGRAHRQVALISSLGNPANYTGSECLPWAGAKTGNNFSVQGNLLTGPEVLEAMSLSFQKTKGFLGERMIQALRDGQKAGGDKRGRQSASLLIVRKNWGYGGLSDRFRDLRVDDHIEPIEELDRIYKLHQKVFPRPIHVEKKPKKTSPIE